MNDKDMTIFINMVEKYRDRSNCVRCKENCITVPADLNNDEVIIMRLQRSVYGEKMLKVNEIVKLAGYNKSIYAPSTYFRYD